MVEARFDDLKARPSRSFRFAGHAGTIEAYAPTAVPAALSALEEAVSHGLWAAGYVAYEAAPGLDPNLAVRERPAADPFAPMPLVWFGLFERRQDAAPLEPPEASYTVSRWQPSVPRREYEAEIERIRDYIRAGDTYQVNHTMRLRARFSGTDRAYYTALCLAQGGAHNAYLDTGRFRVLSASPELFFRLEDDRLTTRPMKGTARRGRWLAEDEEEAAALVSSPKEQAENAMIVDLLRNDLGRISRPSSVRVTRLFDVERYETVWQLTSTVESELRPGLSVTDVFAALFPSGSVTGAPKVRSMEITAELEHSPRGIYTGAIGYLAPPDARGPQADFNVAIRTVVLDPESETVEYGVGGGITYDSSPAREYEECLTKARVLTERRPVFELLEAIGYRDGELLWLDRHLARLESSAAYFDFRCDLGEVRGAVEKAVAGFATDAKVRVSLARRGAARISVEPVELLPRDPEGQPPVRVVLDGEPVDPGDVFLFHKTTLREPYERRAARHPGGDVLLVNTRGEITEATSSNVAVKLGGRWYTPPLESGLLPGVYRVVLLEDGRLEERKIASQDLTHAEGIALLNSVRLWRPAAL